MAKKKIITALEFFHSKHPDKEIIGIKETYGNNNYEITTREDTYPFSVSLSRNTIDVSYPDPDWG